MRDGVLAAVTLMMAACGGSPGEPGTADQISRTDQAVGNREAAALVWLNRTGIHQPDLEMMGHALERAWESGRPRSLRSLPSSMWKPTKRQGARPVLGRSTWAAAQTWWIRGEGDRPDAFPEDAVPPAVTRSYRSAAPRYRRAAAYPVIMLAGGCRLSGGARPRRWSR